MKFSTIRIEGAILSADILDKIEQGELGGQLPKDFGLDGHFKVKDEIVKAWADAQDMWRIFKRQRDSVPRNATGTSETRKYWVIPMLGLLGYDAELSKAEIISGKSYALSHRASNLDGFPTHIMGFNDSLDKKREESGPRMSPHALLQEYLNLTEHLYAIVTNGIHLRLLRDSSRLVKLSFIEFNLEAMMEEEHYADFAIMFRLLHATRMPVKIDAGPESLIEKYHQDALDSGARIREGLSEAVEISILSLGNGFLEHRANTVLREAFEQNNLSDIEYYQYLLRLIYRLLFLMVIEERNLIYTKDADKKKIDIYYNYYSVHHLRKLCEKHLFADGNYDDSWMSLKNTFQLFENEYKGRHLDIKPLNGDLFGYDAIGLLINCDLDNKVLLECLRNLSVFINKKTGQKMRVNYASLNVEEFGSVYEGLLEYAPEVRKSNGEYKFYFVKGTERSSSGSHYTPDELVQPLIKHSLDYIIEDKLKEKEPEKALLSIRVCDVAAGSGHILLNAARRIGTELAKVRTGEDQPSPAAYREGVRDAIKNCIYGVDKNPLAVELCKVSLWLEAHNPGEPLNFLDHHIKCGDAIVGLAHKEELGKGIPNEAFKKLPDDDKEIVKSFAKRNRKERDIKLGLLDFDKAVNEKVKSIGHLFNTLNRMPEKTPEQIRKKRKEYLKLTGGPISWRLKNLADIQVAQFFIPKTIENNKKIITDAEYREYLSGNKQLVGMSVAKAMAMAQEKKIFHWFLEFPEIFEQGGFDCILGNPPFLGNRKLKSIFGERFLEWVKFCYAPAGAIELVGYFFRRIYSIIKPSGFQSLIATNTIAQGEAREGGLEVIAKQGGNINFAIRSMKWPGLAAVEVSLVSIYKGMWNQKFVLNNKLVSYISAYLDDAEITANPNPLLQNSDKSFIGSYILGKGFVLEPNVANKLIERYTKNKDVLFPYLNGKDLNSNPDQSSSRWAINFFDWPYEKCQKEYPDCFEIVQKKVKPERQRMNDGKFVLRKPLPEKWWIYADKRPKLYKTISSLKMVLVTAQVSKTLAFSFVDKNQVLDSKLIVFMFDKYFIFSVLQSHLHYNWAWKHCTTMKSDLSYGNKRIFETFPFPQIISNAMEAELERIGEEYHEFRKHLMAKMQLGLTKTYNLFHTRDLTVENILKNSKQNKEVCESAYLDILKLRQLHKEMDNAVLQAYDWEDINLAHDFYEVDYLPENDRIRFTISPESRKEVLKRLLKLNHEIHEKEVKEALPLKKSRKIVEAINGKNNDANQKVFGF